MARGAGQRSCTRRGRGKGGRKADMSGAHDGRRHVVDLAESRAGEARASAGWTAPPARRQKHAGLQSAKRPHCSTAWPRQRPARDRAGGPGGSEEKQQDDVMARPGRVHVLSPPSGGTCLPRRRPSPASAGRHLPAARPPIRQTAAPGRAVSAPSNPLREPDMPAGPDPAKPAGNAASRCAPAASHAPRYKHRQRISTADCARP